MKNSKTNSECSNKLKKLVIQIQKNAKYKNIKYRNRKWMTQKNEQGKGRNRGKATRVSKRKKRQWKEKNIIEEKRKDQE